MFKWTILLSGYRCDPSEVSEAYITFKWLSILMQRFNIVLLTTDKAESSIYKYYGDKLPDNLKIISFKDTYPFKSKRIIRESLKLGYFFFNYRAKSYLKSHSEIIDGCDLIFHKSPANYRYFTSLVSFKKPLYIGPLSGGLKPPAQLKKYFRKESLLFKFRGLDRVILRLPVYRKQFLQAEKILVSVDYINDLLPARYLAKKRTMLDVGIDCSQFRGSRTENSTVQILYVGRLTRYKGAEILIKAIKEIKEENFILNILGEGEERHRLEGLVEKYGLKNKVYLKGFKISDEVREYYKSASIFCLPALTESIGIVFFEAMASGLPIITMNNGGPKYLCPDEGAIKIPITSESGIIQNLKESILSLIYDSEKRKRMGEFNQMYCLKKYDWTVLEKDILKFFNDELVRATNLPDH